MPKKGRPTADEVLDYVIGTVAGFTRLPKTTVEANKKVALRASPFRFDDARLRSLTMTLRGYVLRFSPNGRIYTREVRKSGLTVEGLGKLVHDKIHKDGNGAKGG